MSSDVVERILRQVERPTPPSNAFAAELLERLVRELEAPVAPRVLPLPRFVLRRPALLTAAAAVLGVAVTAGLVVPRLTAVSAVQVIDAALVSFADLSPFRATIVYDLNPDGSYDAPDVPQGATAEVEVSYGRTGAFRQELVSLAPGVVGTGGSGSFLVFDGVETIGDYRADENRFTTFTAWEGFEPLREFSWNAPYPNWEEICRRGGSEVLPDEPIAGRDAHHIRCGDWTGGFWELWVDAETGVVLKLLGELGRDDYRLGTSERGGFEVTQIEYGVTFDPETFLVAPPAGAEEVGGPTDSQLDLPPLRLTFTRTLGGSYGPASTVSGTISYREESAWRMDILEDTSGGALSGVGSQGFVVWDGEEAGYHDAENNWFLRAPEPPFPPLVWFDPTTDAAFSEGSCDEIAQEEIAGRPARHLRCGNWQQVPGKSADVWLDAEIGIYLRVEDPSGYTLEVSSVELDPAFDDSTFVFSPPPGSRPIEEVLADPYHHTDLDAGELAPPWAADLLDGERFELEASRGRPLLAVFMPDWCPAGDPVCDVLPQLQAAHEAWADRATVIWVDLDATPTEAQEIVERQGYTFPVVLDPPPEGWGRDQPAGSPEIAWGVTGWPLYVLLDAEGRVVEVRIDPQTLAQLNEMLGDTQ